MSDEYQINIPASFMAVHTVPGRIKPSLSRDALAERYDFCEDLAAVLCEKAREVIFDLSVAELDVLERIEAGLLGDGAVVDPAEARWVVIRIAEMLGWTQTVSDLQAPASTAPSD